MNSQDFPDVSQMAAQMAANQARVADYVETLTARVDELVAAAGRGDWDEVRRVSGRLAQRSRAQGYRAVSALAQRVHDEAARPHNALGVKRSLIRLIGTCGRAENRQTGPH